MILGILSDTHGQLPLRVLAVLASCDRWIHAGDVGDPAVLDRLAALTPQGHPLVAVRGNVDGGAVLGRLPVSVEAEAAGVPFLVVHTRGDAERLLATMRRPPALVIFGHSHRPELEWRGETLLLNPGACGPRRFHLPRTVARVTILPGGRLVPEILSVEEE